MDIKPARSARSLPPLRIEHLWLSVPVLLVVWSGFLHRLPLLDFWWHLKTGEIIVNRGALPPTDEFSFTAAGAASAPHAWLAQVIYYLTYRAGGLPLLVALNTALLVAALVPVYALCLRAARGNVRTAMLAALVPAIVLSLFGHVRPQVFSFPLLAFFLWVLMGFKTRRGNWVWTLPPLMALWVNLHGAFVLGLALIGLFLVCESARRFFSGRMLFRHSTSSCRSALLSRPVGSGEPTHEEPMSWRDLSKLAVILVLTAAATLLNPDTYQVYAFVRSIQQSVSVQATVVEWQPPRLDNWQGVLIFYGPFLILLLAVLRLWRRLDLTEWVLFVATAIFAMRAVRNGIWFALVNAPLAALALATLMPGLGPSQTPVARSRPALNWLIAGMLAFLTVLFSPWVRPHLRSDAAGLCTPATPIGAMDYLAEHKVEGHIFHAQSYGDYLIWRLWPEQHSFIDGRVHVFDTAVVRDYMEVFHDPHWQERLNPHWQERLSRYGIHWLLLEKADGDCQRLIQAARASANWQVRYEDEWSVLFEKVDET